MEGFFSFLKPLEIAVSYVLVGFYKVLTFLGLDGASGWTWALSIVGLVIFIRVLLIPLFVKQIKASRAMQIIAPDLKKIQAKYKGKKDQASREALSRETMELYAKHKTNPLASCLPILVQAPIFFALFRTLNVHLQPENAPAIKDFENAVEAGTAVGPAPIPFYDGIGALTGKLAQLAHDSDIFGAGLSETFNTSDSGSVKLVAAVLIAAMVTTTFLTQRQLMRKNMPAAALEGPMAQQQKIMMYALPFIFVISGPIFPIGVLVYWTTTNVWTMGQQFYVIRRNPTPGSAADKALKERAAKKAAAKGFIEESAPEIEPDTKGQRDQPKRKNRKRK